MQLEHLPAAGSKTAHPGKYRRYNQNRLSLLSKQYKNLWRQKYVWDSQELMYRHHQNSKHNELPQLNDW